MAALKRFQTGSDGDGVTVGGNLVVSGSSTLATTAISSADINGGTIDGTAIGGASAAAGAFTTLSATGVTTVQAGTNSAPAITTTGDTNTGIFFPAADTIAFTEGGAEAMRIDSAGNVGIGTSSPTEILNLNASTNVTTAIRLLNQGTNVGFISTQAAFLGSGSSNDFVVSGLGAGRSTIFGSAGTERMRIDSSGNLLVGTTSGALSAKVFSDSAANGILSKCTSAAASAPLIAWNSFTSGDNLFVSFGTEGTYTERGTITYNRAGGLVAYNVTSDYRAKDISGPVTDSGTLIDSTPVYMGKMKGATQERPMFIAHEVPAYAHTGEKDAVDADGKPVYQQMDASALIPVMWAEIQSLRKRLAAANL
jgi:hypothetical protein